MVLFINRRMISFFAMTVSDEVGFALENQGLDENIISVEVQKVLERVGLAGFEQNSIHTYQEDKGSDWLWLQYSSRNLSFWF